MMEVKVKILRNGAVLPVYKTVLAAGCDLAAAKRAIIKPYALGVKIATGIAIEMPAGVEMQIRGRSGLTITTGLRVANAPATIDADYRGEICVIFDNLDDETYLIKPGERIAQGIFKHVLQPALVIVDELSETARGVQGFGHTGT